MGGKMQTVDVRLAGAKARPVLSPRSPAGEEAPAAPRDCVQLGGDSGPASVSCSGKTTASSSMEATAPSPQGAGGVSSGRPAAPKRDWRDEVLYFVMVDRFADGDKTNNVGVDRTNPNKYHGGDWQGVIDHLDDLQKLGATTVWLSPPVLNDHDFLGMAGYHGYWVQDFYKTDPHLGNLEKLRELVDKAHAKGMRVVLDLIVNHVGYNHPWAKDPTKYDWFHHQGNVNVMTNGGLEKGALHGLPDLAQENPEVSDYLIKMSKWWVQQTGIDGFRVDAVRHVPRAWLQKFADEMHHTFGDDFLLLGEAYTPFPKEVATYQSQAHFDSLFDFPVSNAIRSAIGYNDEGGMGGAIADAYKLINKNPHEAFRLLTTRHANMKTLSAAFAADKKYPDATRLATLIDNHDMTRFPVLAGDHARDKQKLALSLLFTMRGIPTLYYGTEDGMGYAADEDNRADKPWNADVEMFKYISELTHVRANSEPLRRGRQVELAADNDVYSFARVTEKEKMIVALNRDGDDQMREIPLDGEAALPDGTVLEDVRTHDTFTVNDGRLVVDVPAREALILRPRT